jgi:hypothetical protein
MKNWGVVAANKRRSKHNLCGTPTHRSWADLRNRCHCKTNPRFDSYGGRGIKVCDRWDDFRNFLSDMGKRPPGTSIGRIDNDGDYCPENCRWETRSQQQRNRRGNRLIKWKGVVRTATEWAEILNININSFRGRLRRKWPIRKVMTHEYSSKR